MRKPPAFQFYADDFLAGVSTMTNEEVGLYIRLLAIQWSRGGVTEEDFRRIGTAIAQPSLNYVKAKFKIEDSGLLKNARLESERVKQSEFRENRSKSGKKGAEKRWHSHSTAIAQPLAKHSSPSPSPSPNSMSYNARVCAERPSLAEVQAYAAQIGLAPWKAEDWFNEMEGCGWLDFNHRPVDKWRPLLARVKAKWEADGRPMSPPSSKFNGGPSTARGGPSKGSVPDHSKDFWAGTGLEDK